jgi:tetratricopeptide (TPR) repeat protein
MGEIQNNYNKMSLNKFLEENIREFLDNELMQRQGKKTPREDETALFNISIDYAKETRIALDEGNTTKAREIFDTLKKQYNKMSDDDFTKEKLYKILEEVFQAIKEYMEKKDQKIPLEQEIKDLDQKKVFKDFPKMPPKPELKPSGMFTEKKLKVPEPPKEETKKEAPKKEEKPAEEPEPKKEEKPKEEEPPKETPEKALEQEIDQTIDEEKKVREEIKKEEPKKVEEIRKELKKKEEVAEFNKIKEDAKLRKEVKEKIDNIRKGIKQKDLKNSILAYRELKTLLQKHPDRLHQEKEELLKDLMSYYHQIKMLEKITQEKQQHQENKEIMERTQKRKEKTETIETLKSIIEDITDNMAENKLKEAEAGIIKAKHQLTKVPENMDKEKEIFKDMISNLIHRVEFMKKTRPTPTLLVKKSIKTIDERTLYQQAIARMKTGKNEEAKRILREVLRRNPNHRAAQIRINQITGK